MSNKTLNILIQSFLALVVGGGIFLIYRHDLGLRYGYVLMLVLVVTVILLMMKVISSVFLSGFKGQPVSFIENIYPLFWLLLTAESRQEWRDYIQSQKQST